METCTSDFPENKADKLKTPLSNEKLYFLLKMVIFQCHVSELRGVIPPNLHDFGFQPLVFGGLLDSALFFREFGGGFWMEIMPGLLKGLLFAASIPCKL